MSWEKKKRPKNARKFIISEHLKSKNKINDEFEVMLANLTLEELVSLKLEISSQNIAGKFFGFRLWKELPKIIRRAVLLYSYAAGPSNLESAAFLGVTRQKYYLLLDSYNIRSYFSEEEEKGEVNYGHKKGIFGRDSIRNRAKS